MIHGVKFALTLIGWLSMISGHGIAHDSLTVGVSSLEWKPNATYTVNWTFTPSLPSTADVFIQICYGAKFPNDTCLLPILNENITKLEANFSTNGSWLPRTDYYAIIKTNTARSPPARDFTNYITFLGND